MAALLLPAGVAPAAAQAGGTTSGETYFPEPGNWERRAPEQVGMNAALLREAVAFATDPANEGVERDLRTHLLVNFAAKEPMGELVGPIKPHGPPTGMIVRNGYIVAEWGEPERVDMTSA